MRMDGAKRPYIRVYLSRLLQDHYDEVLAFFERLRNQGSYTFQIQPVVTGNYIHLHVDPLEDDIRRLMANSKLIVEELARTVGDYADITLVSHHGDRLRVAADPPPKVKPAIEIKASSSW